MLPFSPHQDVIPLYFRGSLYHSFVTEEITIKTEIVYGKSEQTKTFFIGLINCYFHKNFTPFDISELLIAFKSPFSSAGPIEGPLAYVAVINTPNYSGKIKAETLEMKTCLLKCHLKGQSGHHVHQVHRIETSLAGSSVWDL